MSSRFLTYSVIDARLLALALSTFLVAVDGTLVSGLLATHGRRRRTAHCVRILRVKSQRALLAG